MPIKNYLERGLIIGLYFLLLTPLLFQQSLIHPLITFKTVILQVVIEILAAVYIYLIIFHKEYRPQITLITLSILVLLVAVFLSGIFGVDFYRSFWSVAERMTGIFLWLHLAALFFILRSLGDKINWVRYFSFSVLVSFFAALFPVIQLIFPGVFFDKVSGRLSGTIGNPIFLSIYLLFHLFIGLWLAAHFWKKNNNLFTSLFVISAGFNLVVIFLTQTRGTFIGLLAGFLFLFTTLAFKNFWKTKRYIIIAVIVFLIASASFFVFTRNTYSFWQNVPLVGRFVGDLGVGPRFFAWEVSIKTFLEKPVFGWGWENFYYAFNNHYEPSLLKYGFGETYFDKPHNVFLEFLTNTGLLGFLAYLWLLFAAFRGTTRLKEGRTFIQALLIGYLIHNFFALDTLTSYLMFFVILAFIDPVSSIDEVKNYVEPKWRLVILIILLTLSSSLIYFVNYRLWIANHWEYFAANYFVQDRGEEGLEYFNAAIDAPSVYSDQIKNDLGTSVPSFLKQGVPIPDGKNLIKRSMEELKKVADRNPLQYFYHLSLADTANISYIIDSSYLDLAEEELKIAEKLSPKRQSTLHVLSKTLYLKGDKEGAISAMKKATDLAPEVPEPHFFYGMFLLDSGQNKEAIKELKSARDLGRMAKNVDEARLLGGYFADAEYYDIAVDYFQKALEFDPKDKEAKMKLGLTYYLMGKLDLAKKFIGEVIATEDLSKSPQYEAIKPILKDLGLEE